MDALEMDVVISADKEVVIAHEPYMPSNICRMPDGSTIDPSKEESINLYKMDYAQIRSFDCGLKHPQFPEQVAEPTYRPLLAELFEVAEAYCEQEEKTPISYTIEIKCTAEQDGIYHPGPAEFVSLVLDVIKGAKLEERCVLQSFDYRVLTELHKQAPEITLSLLIDRDFDIMEELDILGFMPAIIGPKFNLLNSNLVDHLHKKGMRVVPWTVNEVADMQDLIAMGVDGIITDYPNRKSEMLLS